MTRKIMMYTSLFWWRFPVKWVTWMASVHCDLNANLKHHVHNGLGHPFTCMRSLRSWSYWIMAHQQTPPFWSHLWVRITKQSGGMWIVSQSFSLCLPVTHPFTTACPSVFESFHYKYMSFWNLQIYQRWICIVLSRQQDNCLRLVCWHCPSVFESFHYKYMSFWNLQIYQRRIRIVLSRKHDNCLRLVCWHCPSVFESFHYKYMSPEICKSTRGEFASFFHVSMTIA